MPARFKRAIGSKDDTRNNGQEPEYPCEGAEYGVCGGWPHTDDCPSSVVMKDDGYIGIAKWE